MRNWSCTVISERRALRLTTLGLLLALLCGCTNLFFLPMRKQVLTPAQLGLESRDVALTTEDGVRLFAWHLSAANPRGVVCYFHGNAENISTHILNVSWLPAAGHEVLLVDYRGYGASAGKPAFPDVFADVRAGLDWCLARGRETGLPVFALGQSLGASLLLDVAVREPYRDELAGVVADSGFASYRGIARDAMKQAWLLRPLRWPLSWLVTGEHAPEEAVAQLGRLPLLVMHSPDDAVVPYAHGERIHAGAVGRTCFLRTQGPHIAALNPRYPESGPWQQAVLDFLAAWPDAGAIACPVVRLAPPGPP